MDQRVKFDSSAFISQGPDWKKEAKSSINWDSTKSSSSVSSYIEQKDNKKSKFYSTIKGQRAVFRRELSKEWEKWKKTHPIPKIELSKYYSQAFPLPELAETNKCPEKIIDLGIVGSQNAISLIRDAKLKILENPVQINNTNLPVDAKEVMKGKTLSSFSRNEYNLNKDGLSASEKNKNYVRGESSNDEQLKDILINENHLSKSIAKCKTIYSKASRFENYLENRPPTGINSQLPTWPLSNSFINKGEKSSILKTKNIRNVENTEKRQGSPSLGSEPEDEFFYA